MPSQIRQKINRAKQKNKKTFRIQYQNPRVLCLIHISLGSLVARGYREIVCNLNLLSLYFIRTYSQSVVQKRNYFHSAHRTMCFYVVIFQRNILLSKSYIYYFVINIIYTAAYIYKV